MGRNNRGACRERLWTSMKGGRNRMKKPRKEGRNYDRFVGPARALLAALLAKRTCRRSWDDEVFGQAARLAFYYFLSMFPVLLLLLIWLDKFAGAGSTGSNLRDTLLGFFRQVLPREASELMAKTVGQLNAGAVIGAGAVYAGLGSFWGALNGTWAMMTGLNKAYEVKEERRWWRVLTIAFGLTSSLAIMGLIALAAILYGNAECSPGDDRPLPISLAHYTVADDSHTAALLVRVGLSFRSQLKGSAMALEFSRRRCRRYVMGRLHASAPVLSESLQFPKNLRRRECGG